jgi:hypothetical protein
MKTKNKARRLDGHGLIYEEVELYPCEGDKFSSQKAVIEAFTQGHLFQMNNDGCYTSIRDFSPGVFVKLHYSLVKKPAIHQVQYGHSSTFAPKPKKENPWPHVDHVQEGEVVYGKPSKKSKRHPSVRRSGKR